jgi:hypothetical protein
MKGKHGESCEQINVNYNWAGSDTDNCSHVALYLAGTIVYLANKLTKVNP